MKFVNVSAKWFAVVSLLLMFACTAENVEPGNGNASSGDQPVLAGSSNPHPVVDPECSPRMVYPLIDESGGLNVNYWGPFGNNTGTPTSWGSVNVVNSDQDLVMEIDLAYGWYVDYSDLYLGASSAVTLLNGIPTIGPAWNRINVNPIINSTEIWTPISALPSSCFGFALHLSVVRMDFFQGIDQASRTDLWIYNSDWNNPSTPAANSPSFAIGNWCIATCPVVSRSGSSIL